VVVSAAVTWLSFGAGPKSDAHLEDDGVALLAGRDGDLLGELVHGLELGVDLLQDRGRIAGPGRDVWEARQGKGREEGED
jgi:hypothetical protein